MAEESQYHNKGVLKKTFQQTIPAYAHSSTTPKGDFIFDGNGIILEAGSGGAELVGHQGENLLGHSFGAFIEGNYKDTFYTHYRKVFDTKAPQACSVRMMNRMGIPFHAKLESTPVTDLKGNQLCKTLVTDISRRKRVAEEMLEKEIEYKKAQRIAGIGSFRINFKTGVQDWSDQLFSLLGVEIGEVPSTYVSFMEFVHPDDREGLNRESRATLDGNRNLDIEYRIVRKDGELRHLHTRAEIERDADGSPVWIYGFYQDITERVKSEEALKESEEKYRLLFSAESDAIMLFDAETFKFIDVNDAAVDLYGYSREEFLKLTLAEISNEWQATQKSVRETIERGHKKILMRRHRKKDGTVFFVEISGGSFILLGRRVICGVIRDITSRKKSEDALKKFKFISDHSNDAHFLLGKDAKFQYVNKTACRMFGYCEEEFLSLSVTDVDDEYDIEKYHELFDLIQQEAVPSFESTTRRKDGTVFPSELTVTGYRIEGTYYMFAVLRDITERKKDIEKALRVNQLASIGELAAGVAHEVNNPINGIINYAQILENRSEPLSREWDICNRIIKEGDRIAYIVSSLLSFARESSEEKTSTNICDIICSTLDLINTPLKKDNIRVDVSMPSHTGVVFGKPEQIRQVFLNIISNARYALNHKYPGGSDNKILEINCEEKREDGCSIIRIVFHDRGTGIPEELLNKVMNPFFTSKPGQDGTGLGLSISNNIISEHGGDIIIQSKEGEFTKVIITLPVETE